MIFQEPMNSFSPVHTIGSQLMEAILLHQKMTEKEARAEGVELFAPRWYFQCGRANGQLSVSVFGRNAPRAMIAMALSCNPSLLDRGRTDYGVGCNDSGPNPRSIAPSSAAVRHGGDVHYPQFGCHRANRRSRRDYVSRAGRGRGSGPRNFTKPQAPLHGGPFARGAAPGQDAANGWLPSKAQSPARSTDQRAVRSIPAAAR